MSPAATRRRSRGVAGWVTNRADGTVEAVFEGSEEAVAQCVAWCRQGPPRAEVTGLDVTEEDPAGDVTFRVR